MKCWKYENSIWRERRCLMEALQPDAGSVFSMVGGGGKTSTILQLAKEFTHIGRSCAVMPSTHMFLPKGETLWEYLPENWREESPQVYWFGKRLEDNGQKIAAPGEKIMAELFGQKLPILIEADGSKGLPCKAPATHEPVLLSETTCVCGILGLDALGKTIEAVCHRPELVSELLKKQIHETLKPEDLAALAASPKGMKKQVRPQWKYIVILNKADTLTSEEAACQIAERLCSLGISHIVMTSYK